MIRLKGVSSIIKEWDILHGCYATVCMPGYKPNHGLYIWLLGGGPGLRRNDAPSDLNL